MTSLIGITTAILTGPKTDDAKFWKTWTLIQREAAATGILAGGLVAEATTASRATAAAHSLAPDRADLRGF